LSFIISSSAGLRLVGVGAEVDDYGQVFEKSQNTR